jgi:hypothetical protein
MAIGSLSTATARRRLAALVCAAVLFGIPAGIASTRSASAATFRAPAWHISGHAAIGPGPTFFTSKVSVSGGPGWVPQLVDPAVALSRGGGILAAWPGPSGVLAARGSVRAASFGAPSQLALSLPAGAEPTGVTAAINSLGDAMVGWRAGAGPLLDTGRVSGVAFLMSSAGIWSGLPLLEGPSWESAPTFAPSVAFDGRGDGFAVWVAPAVRPGSGIQPQEQVDASVMPAGTGAWQAPIAISPVRPAIDDPQVAVNGGGGALAAWSTAKSIPGAFAVEASLRQAGARWSSPATLGSGEEPRAVEYEPMVTIRPRDEALVVWRPPGGEPGRWPHLLSRTASLADGRWSRPQAIPGSATETTASGMANDRHGDTLLWWATDRGGVATLRAVMSAPAKRWSSASTITSWRSAPVGAGLEPPTCRNGPQPFVAFDRREDAIAVWREACGPTFTAMRRTATARWTRAEPLVGLPVGASSRFAVGGAGELVAVWLEPSAVSVGQFGSQQVATTVAAAVFRQRSRH